jgi:hypothetical protein
MPADAGDTHVEHQDPRHHRRPSRHRRDKPAFKTTELVVWALTVAGVLVAAAVTENLDGHDAWKYVTWLSIGYMISRGLAKAGSYAKDNDPRTADYNDR